MSPSSTVHGGQHDTKYVTFELLLDGAIVTDENWGDMLENPCQESVCPEKSESFKWESVICPMFGNFGLVGGKPWSYETYQQCEEYTRQVLTFILRITRTLVVHISEYNTSPWLLVPKNVTVK